MPSREVTNSFGDVIDAGRLRIVEFLGVGTFGAVYRVVDMRSYRQYAVKCLLLRDDDNSTNPNHKDGRRRTTYDRFQGETSMHAAVSAHPHVLTLHRTFIENGRLYFVFDLCLGGNLLTSITERGIFWRRDDLIKASFLQIVDAVRYCHRRGIAHRDLKPENILVSGDGRDYYIADFGLASEVVDCRQFGAGSKYFKSPECIGTEIVHSTYNTQISDVWSLGIVLVTMIAGRYPWKRAHTSDDNFAHYVNDASYLSTILPTTPDATAFLISMLNPDPSKRMRLSQVGKEIAKVKRFILSDVELATASESARATVENYAILTGKPYELPPLAEPSDDSPASPIMEQARPAHRRPKSAFLSALCRRVLSTMPTPPSSSLHTPRNDTPQTSGTHVRTGSAPPFVEDIGAVPVLPEAKVNERKKVAILGHAVSKMKVW